MARKQAEKRMRNAAPLGLLLILVGLLTVPFVKDVLGRILLFAIFGGAALIFVVFIVGGLILIAFREAN